MRQLAAFIVHRRCRRVDIHIARKGIDDFDDVTTA